MKLRSIDLELDPEDNATIATINESIEKNQEEYRRFYQLTQAIVGENADVPEGVDVLDELPAAISATGGSSIEPDKPKRGRRPKNSPDPATAVAPPPLAVPNAATPAPAPVNTSIPPFLDRTGAATTATIAPPPPVPAPAAPAPAAPPPVGVLAGKVVTELKRRGEGAADNGAALVAWLASAGLVVPGATFQEAIDCVSFLDDAKLGPVATGLGVS